MQREFCAALNDTWVIGRVAVRTTEWIHPEMTVKWKGKVLRVGRKKLRFDEEIIIAGGFKSWTVACTPTKMYFYGYEDIVLARPIRNALIKRDGVYYQHRRSSHVFIVSNPLEPEEFVFYRHGFLLKEVVSDVLVLEDNGRYLLRSVSKSRDAFGCSDGTSILDGSFDEFNKTRMLSMRDIGGKMKCFIDENGEKHDGRYYGYVSVDMIEYDNFLVAMHRSTASFIKVDGSKGGVKRSKLPSEMNVTFSRDVEYFVKYRMRTSRDGYLEFLRINETLFLGNEVICDSIDDILWPRSLITWRWKRDYHIPFWNGMSRLEKGVLSCCHKTSQRDFIEAFVRFKEKRFELLKPTRDGMARIDRMFEACLVRCKSVWEFLSLELPPIDLPVISRCKRLIKHTHPLSTCAEDVLDVKYTRIVGYNAEIIGSMKYSEINNLAYRVIYMELNRARAAESTGPIRSVGKMCRLAAKHFGDPRMEEMVLLFNERPRVFEIDENDLENKKERSYILRMACNIGRAYLFYASDIVEDRYDVLPLRFSIYKNDELGEIDIKESGWSDWPSFNHSVYRGVSLSLCDDISHNFIDTKVREFISSEEGSEFALAGTIFAFGLHKRLSGMHPRAVMRLVTSRYPVISMALVAGVGISNIGKRDEELGKLYVHYLKSANPLYIHVGCIIGLGALYSGSGNVLVRETLVVEANRDGVFRYEVHNKGNKIWYDYGYRVSASLSIAMLYAGTNLEMFRFISLNDSLCELLTNGIVLFGAKQMKFMKRLQRGECDRLEEVLYSELFMLGLALDDDLDGIVRGVREKYASAKACELYRISGRILYVSVYVLYRNVSVDFDGHLFRTILEICLSTERLVKKNDEFKVLFDTCVVALSLMSNSSSNLDIIRILRRQIKMTERSKFLSDQVDFFFTTSRCRQEAGFTIRYGDIEKYKMCLGIAACGMGFVKISNTSHVVLDVIATFFINFPISSMDQEYFNMFRYFLLMSMRKNSSSFRNSTEYPKMSSRNSKKAKIVDMSKINKTFVKAYSNASNADKKLVVDVLTDFYEQHGDGSTLLDVEMLKDLACKSI